MSVESFGSGQIGQFAFVASGQVSSSVSQDGSPGHTGSQAGSPGQIGSVED